MYQLSRHLFYVNPHALHAAAGAFQDGVHFFDGRVVLEANEASHAQGFFFVLDNLCAAKDDDALDVVRPVAIFFIVFVKNSKSILCRSFLWRQSYDLLWHHGNRGHFLFHHRRS